MGFMAKIFIYNLLLIICIIFYKFIVKSYPPVPKVPEIWFGNNELKSEYNFYFLFCIYST